MMTIFMAGTAAVVKVLTGKSGVSGISIPPVKSFQAHAVSARAAIKRIAGRVVMASPCVQPSSFHELLQRRLGAARHHDLVPPVLPRRHHTLLAQRAISLLEPLACRQAGGFGLAGAVGVFIALLH